MNRIDDFNIERNKFKFTWNCNGIAYERQFIYPIKSVIELCDKSGFALVGASEEYGKSNAMLINADGSIRAQVRIPDNLEYPICFYEIYYVNQELTGMFACRYVDYACVINETTGDCIKVYVTR